jgi:hypothetical protein
MSVANAYPESAAILNAGHTVQNVQLAAADGTPVTVVDLARDAGTRFLAFVFAGGTSLERFAPVVEEQPVVLHLVGPGGLSDPEGRLAKVLGARRGSLAVVRPDLYVAGVLHDAAPKDLAAALTRALCRHPLEQPA